MPDAEESPSFGMALDTVNKTAAFKERVNGHEWRIELREHKMADYKRSIKAPTIAISIRCDGELLATVYPTQVGGFGVQVASEVLDFEEPYHVDPVGGAQISPAVIYLRKDHKGQGGENGNRRGGAQG